MGLRVLLPVALRHLVGNQDEVQLVREDGCRSDVGSSLEVPGTEETSFQG